MYNNAQCNDLQDIITQAIEDIKSEQGADFDLKKVSVAEMVRRTGITRSRMRRIKANGFILPEHGLIGRKAEKTVMSGFTGVVETLLRKGVTNSAVIYKRLSDAGYSGGLSSVKAYISNHKDLVPAKRQEVDPQGNRGRRYHTGPGETYQMDWGFVNVETNSGVSYRAACFAMICHHCGQRYIEFFPNAKQENLFIGMIHTFQYMGIPETVLTDNMKSVVISRDAKGHPIWNKEYASFMKTVGFQTKLCKPRHPFTKGAVERLVQFVKDNFLAARTFSTITDLNYEAVRWCDQQNSVYHQCVDCIPVEKHTSSCMNVAEDLIMTRDLLYYLCPERKISFDGFIGYEGRRFGVPYWYTQKTCRVQRDHFELIIYAADLSREIVRHNVTWSRKDSYCEGQFSAKQPEEQPTMPVRTTIVQRAPHRPAAGFGKFDFQEGLWNE